MYKRARDGVGSEGEWAARGVLYPLLQLFEVPMSQRSANNRPNMPRGSMRHLTTTGVNFRPMPSM